MEQLKLVDIKPCYWPSVSIAAKRFMEDFPDRMGIRQGVVYTREEISFYIYRTKTQIIVRGY